MDSYDSREILGKKLLAFRFHMLLENDLIVQLYVAFSAIGLKTRLPVFGFRQLYTRHVPAAIIRENYRLQD